MAPVRGKVKRPVPKCCIGSTLIPKLQPALEISPNVREIIGKIRDDWLHRGRDFKRVEDLAVVVKRKGAESPEHQLIFLGGGIEALIFDLGTRILWEVQIRCYSQESSKEFSSLN